ncbi:MAG: hypothetical protein RB296_08645 [Acidobacteriota bacterium]|jgi:hypothetical protein|nr:hypothetical protein [Acidobacteriota bacterium]
MHAIQAYLASFRGRTAAVAVYAWLAGLLFSLPAYLGFFRLISSTLADSLLLERSDHYGAFTVWLELLYRGKSGFSLLFGQLAILLLAYGLFSLFFSGGVYGVFVSRTAPRLPRFLKHGWNHFAAFLKLFLVCLIVWIPVLLISLLGFILLAGILRESGNEIAFRWLGLAWLVITGLMMAYAWAVFDFARIRRLEGAGGTWRSFRAGMRFVHNHLFSIWLLDLLFLLPFLLIFPLTSVFRGLAAPWPLMLMFLGLQVLAWLRAFFRIVFMHAEVLLISGSPPGPAAELDADGEPDTI